MADPAADLGERISTHGISPAYLQRAAFVSVLSFAFFLLMMFGFYIRQSFGYFLLATAFLLIYLFTLFGWFTQKKNLVEIYERGFRYRSRHALWSDVCDVSGSVIKLNNAEPIEIPNTIRDFDRLIQLIRFRSTLEN